MIVAFSFTVAGIYQCLDFAITQSVFILNMASTVHDYCELKAIRAYPSHICYLA